MEKKELRKLKRVVIKEEIVALTGKINEAIVLNQMIYWSERVRDSDKFVSEELERARKFADGSEETLEEVKDTLKSGWIYKSSDEIIDDCMLSVSRKTMDRVFEKLVENGWLDRRRNPKYKWDKTWQYRVNLNKIQNDLIKLGYNLEGYSLPENVNEEPNGQNDLPKGHGDDSEGQNDLSIGQNDLSIGQNDLSIGQNDLAIPEITTEITSFEEEEDIIIENGKNPFYKELIIFLKDSQTPENIIDEIIHKMNEEQIGSFLIDDVIRQFKFMMDKLEYGEEIYDFSTYFVNGVKKRIEKTSMNKQHQITKLKEFREAKLKREKRDLDVYYNWLEG